VRAVFCLWRVIPWHLPYNWGKNPEKTSVRVSQNKIKKNHNHKSQYKILQSLLLSAKQHTLLFTVIKNRNRINTSLYTVIKIHNKHKHTIKTTACYVGCVSRRNVEGKTFVNSIHSSLAWLKWRYTIRTRIFKFCDKATQ